MSAPVLFIRADDNGFENFISAQIRARGYEVVEPYSVPVGEIYSLPFFPRVLFRHGPVFTYSSLMGQWKEKISSYDTVIIFDKALTVQLVRAIRKYAPRCRIIVWMWNCREVEDLDEISGLADIYWFDPGYAEKKI
ncbi:MAG: hypothetical protein IKE53_01845 [Clostridiales bacterium]|nr:hypothetical protein [Clostridiales bacterium]